MVKYQKKINSIKSTSGFSLIELMIGLVLGLFITTVAITYLVSSSKAFRIQNDDGRLQENARFALDILTKNVRMAGSNSSTDQTVNLFFSGLGCPDDAGNGTATACTGDSLDEDADSSGTPDSDRFAVEMITRAGVNDIAASSGNGCTGQNVGFNADGSGRRMANVFWIADGNLNCATYTITAGVGALVAGSAQPMIEGVDAMQVQYGEDLDNDGVVERYTSFASVTDIDNVRSLRIALLMSSDIQRKLQNNNPLNQQNDEQAQVKTYTLLDSAPITTPATDRSVRQVYSTTIMLPNN